MALFHAGLQPALDANGNPISGATWNFYLTGTLTAASVYSNSTLATSLGSTVTANSAGRFAVMFLDDAITYRAILKDAGGTTIKDIDPVNPGLVSTSSTRATMATLQTGTGRAIYLTESGREGYFTWNSSNLSSLVTADTQQGVYVAPSSDTTGASGAWVRVVDTWYRITWFGSTMATACAGAISLLDALGGGTIFCPEGFYQFPTTGFNLSGKGNIRIKGEGRNATSFVIAGDNVKVIEINSSTERCSVEDVWIGSFVARSGTYGIYCQGTSGGAPSAYIDFSRITFQNCNNALWCKNLHNSTISNLYIFQSVSGACTGNQITFDDCITIDLDKWVGIATAGTFGSDFMLIANDCDTLIIKNGGAAGITGYGVRTNNATGSTGPRLVHLTTVFMESCTKSGFFNEGPCRDFNYTDCHSAVNTEHGILIAHADAQVTINGGVTLENGQHGVYITACDFVMLSGGFESSHNSRTTNNTHDGIRLENNVTNVTIGDVRSDNFMLSGGNAQRYGLSISNTGTDFITVSPAARLGGVTAGLLNLSPGLNNRICNPNDTFTGTLTGCATSPTAAVEFAVVDRTVTLRLPALTAVSNTTAATITGGPARMRPTAARTCIARIVDNSVTAFGLVTVETTGTLTLSTGAAAGAFTAANNKGAAVCEISYALD